MIALFERACARHRRVLLESLDGRWDQATPDALAHLDHCSDCERELQMTALTLAALRRLAAEAARVNPPATGWGVVRSRIERPAASAWTWAVGIAKATVSVGLLIGVLAPLGMTQTTTPVEETVPAQAAVRTARVPRATRAPIVVSTSSADRGTYEKGPRTFAKQPVVKAATAVRDGPAAPAPTTRAR